MLHSNFHSASSPGCRQVRGRTIDRCQLIKHLDTIARVSLLAKLFISYADGVRYPFIALLLSSLGDLIIIVCVSDDNHGFKSC
jgi:hypothetical protein